MLNIIMLIGIMVNAAMLNVVDIDAEWCNAICHYAE